MMDKRVHTILLGHATVRRDSRSAVFSLRQRGSLLAEEAKRVSSRLGSRLTERSQTIGDKIADKDHSLTHFVFPIFTFSACGVRRLGENSIVQPLQPPDVFHLSAAQGWLELGNHLEADAELENIAPLLRAHPAVLDLRWQIFAKEKKWDACRDIAEAITKQLPDEPVGWLHLAYATRRVAGGNEQAAFEALFPVVERFPEVWEIPYNLACYSSMLGNFEAAQSWFKKAMAVGGKPVQSIALDDPDLKPLWDSMAGTVWKKEGP
jgi:hypothetical protein